MSVFQPRALRCPHCGHTNTETVALSLHGPRVSEVVAAIRAGTFQSFECGSCGGAYRGDGPLIFVDFEEKHWIGVFPRDQERSWALLEQQPLDSFRRALIDHAPPVVRSMSDGFRIRTVFGLDALAEKLTLLDTGIDDRVVEMVKLAVVLTRGAMLHPGRRPHFLSFDDESGLQLLVPMSGDDGVEARVATVATDQVAAWSADARWHPVIDELSSGPYVDVGRLLLDGRVPL